MFATSPEIAGLIGHRHRRQTMTPLFRQFSRPRDTTGSYESLRMRSIVNGARDRDDIFDRILRAVEGLSTDEDPEKLH
jgi:hypothetical protein